MKNAVLSGMETSPRLVCNPCTKEINEDVCDSAGVGKFKTAAESPNTPLSLGFDVVDTQTGEYPDLWNIAMDEQWANGLIYCDMEGFAISEGGSLILMDECGNFAYPPQGRFKVVFRKPKGGKA